MELLKMAVFNHLRTIHFCYSILYPKIYIRTNSFGISNKSSFDFVFAKWKKNKTLQNPPATTTSIPQTNPTLKNNKNTSQ